MYYKTTAHGLPQIITEADYKALTPGKRMLYVECDPNEPIGIGAPPHVLTPRDTEKYSKRASIGVTGSPPNMRTVFRDGQYIEEDNDISALNTLMFGAAVVEALDENQQIFQQQQEIDILEQQQLQQPVQDPAPFEGMGGGSFGGGGSSGTWDDSQQTNVQPDPVQDTYQQPDPEPVYTPDPEPTYTPDPEPTDYSTPDTTDYSSPSDDNY